MSTTQKMSKKDEAIKYGITQQKVVDRFNKKLSKKKNGCIEINTFAFDSRDRYRGFTISYPDKNNTMVQATVKAHRFAYALEHGFDALPFGDLVDNESECINHICGNTKCVNTDHLNIMTVKENAKYRSPMLITTNMINAKTCKKCNIDKTYSEFYKRTSMTDGHDYYCKDCRNYYTTKNAHTGDKLCTISDGYGPCTNFHYARQMCKNHYHQFLYAKKNKMVNTKKQKENKNG